MDEPTFEKRNIITTLFETPLRASLTIGLAGALSGGTITYSVMSYQDSNRGVYTTTLATEDPNVIHRLPLSVRVTSDIIDTYGMVSEMYVRASGSSKDGKSWNDTVARNSLDRLQRHLEITIADSREMQDLYKKFSEGFGHLESTAAAMGAGFSHKAEDNGHMEGTTSESCDSNNNCTSTTTYSWEYDNTDHEWKFDRAQCDFGLKYFDDAVGLMKMAGDLPPAVNGRFHAYVPSEKVDAVGRLIDQKEKDIVVQEWQNHFLAADVSAISGFQGVRDAQAIQTIRDSQANGYSRGYQNKSTRNYCPKDRSGCDIEDSPLGYREMQNSVNVVNGYLGSVRHLGSVLRQTVQGAQSLQLEVTALRNKESFEAEDLEQLSERAISMYHSFAPESKVTPPSASARTWWPVGIGGGIFGVASLIGLYLQSQEGFGRRRRRYY